MAAEYKDEVSGVSAFLELVRMKDAQVFPLSDIGHCERE